MIAPQPQVESRTTVPPRARALGLLLLSAVLFGTTWPIQKIGLRDASPIWLAAGRAWLSAGAAFALLLALGQLRRPTRHDLPIVLSIALFQLAAFFALSNIGLRYVPAGRSAVLAYTTTLWVLPFGVLVLRERLGWLRGLGALAGLAGVAVLFNPLSMDWRDRALLIGNGCLLLAALSWALALLHTRCHVWRLSPLQLLPWQMALAGLLLSALAGLADPAGWIHATPSLVLSLGWLGLIAGPIGSWAAVTATRALPTLISSLGFLGVPLVGILLSTLWLGEPLTASLLGGSGLILLGLALVSLG